MREKIIYYIAAAVIIFIIAICFILFGGENDIRGFLGSYGYKVSNRPRERMEIYIPKPLDAVFESYNDIQKKAGFDLTEYEGKKGMRYTYDIKNYPGNIEGVRANIIVINGEIVGGDICTVKLDGFMHEIKPISEIQKSLSDKQENTD